MSVRRRRAPRTRDPDRDAIRIRARLVLLALALSLVLAACGTWDPTNQPQDEGAAGGAVDLDVGDLTYSFSVDECFASPEDGIQVRATTTGGEELHIDYSADAPRDRTIQVVDDGEIILDGAAVEGMDDPDLTIEEGGFSGTATFRRTDGSEVGGEMSGAC